MLGFSLAPPALQLRCAISGGASETVFPAVEAWLASDGDHFHAFEQIKGRKSTSRYRSLVDFLLCEVCPAERAACFAYYAGKGGPLREIRIEKELRLLETKLLLFLALAYEARGQRRRLSFRQAVDFVDEVCTQAA